MSSLLKSLHALSPGALAGMRRGVEKESLRALPQGDLALTPHPAVLGSALTNPYITTEMERRICWVRMNAQMPDIQNRVFRHPDFNVDRLAALVGRGPSWLYAFLGRHRELPWVREILD